MGIEEILGEKRADILSIVARHGARNVRVFGSTRDPIVTWTCWSTSGRSARPSFQPVWSSTWSSASVGGSTCSRRGRFTGTSGTGCSEKLCPCTELPVPNRV